MASNRNFTSLHSLCLSRRPLQGRSPHKSELEHVPNKRYTTLRNDRSTMIIDPVAQFVPMSGLIRVSPPLRFRVSVPPRALGNGGL